MPNPFGGFVWYELMTTDPTAAEAFYRGVIGWTARDAGMPEMSYTILSAGEAGVAGLMTIPEAARAMGARPGWMGYVGVEDVDASAAQASREGGTVHRTPADIPGVGRFAVIADPDGAMLALFRWGSDEPERPPAPGGTPGHAGWRELHASDREAAFAFYAKLFGWTKGEAMDMGAMGIYQIIVRNGEMLGGMMTKSAAMPVPFWLYYFNIDDIDAAMARVRDGGGQILHGPQQVPGGSWIAQCLDPQGAAFALVGPKN